MLMDMNAGPIKFKALFFVLICFCLCLSGPYIVSAASENYLSDELNAALPNAKVYAISIIGGGAPQESDLPVLKKEGFRTLIDFRTSEEISETYAAEVDGLGMRYINIPVASTEIDDSAVKRLDQVLQAEGGYPVVMHCRSGRRVEAVWQAFQNRDAQ